LSAQEAGERGLVVGDVALQALKEAMALVVKHEDSKPIRSEVDGGELDHPAGLAGEAVHDGDGADDGDDSVGGWGWGQEGWRVKAGGGEAVRTLGC
jgi:hypothetical protein